MEDYQAMMKKKNYRYSHKRNIQDTFMDPNMVHTDVNGLCLWLVGDETSLADRLFSFSIFEPHREKTGFLPRRKQRRRSASR